MPLYATPQSGYNTGANEGLNVRDVSPGASLTLFDGTETPALNLASVAFARSGGAGMTFLASGMPSDMTIDIEAALEDVDAKYSSISTISPDANGNGTYTDVGYSAFYRGIISAASGSSPAVMPTLKVQR